MPALSPSSTRDHPLPRANRSQMEADTQDVPPPHMIRRARRFVVINHCLRYLLAMAILVAFWLTLAPTSMGGRASYVVTDGTSMLPHFRAGGIVLTRAESNYSIGEVVAYHNQQFHAVVMHRIVARDGDRYVFRGDNNSSDDKYHPTRADLVGKEWLYWPGGAKYFELVHSPGIFGLSMAFMAIIIFAPPITRRRRRRRHHTRA